ncbi:MAG: hypothetical protein K5868_02610 [Lachnospiraceae bacterium]|nr:hypothetical protein [Lachnospiraceae bacterium]
MNLKEIWECIFPMSSRSIRYEIRELEKKIDDIGTQLRVNEEALMATTKELKDTFCNEIEYRCPVGHEKEMQLKKQQFNILYLMGISNMICALHSSAFHEYKECFRGRDVVLLGTGPTLEYYNVIDDVVHIGVNSAYKFNKDILDFHFFSDYRANGKIFDSDEIAKLDCVKFVGYDLHNFDLRYKPPHYLAEYISGKPYYCCNYFGGEGIDFHIPTDIEKFPLVHDFSVIFEALHFALFTHPRRIFIVGCDCSDACGWHFDGTNPDDLPREFPIIYENWKRMANHIRTYYPDIEIVSINPVGLKGLFSEKYTQSYISSELYLKHKAQIAKD